MKTQIVKKACTHSTLTFGAKQHQVEIKMVFVRRENGENGSSTLSLSLSLSLSHTHTLSLSLSNTHTHLLSHVHTCLASIRSHALWAGHFFQATQKSLTTYLYFGFSQSGLTCNASSRKDFFEGER